MCREGEFGRPREVYSSVDGEIAETSKFHQMFDADKWYVTVPAGINPKWTKAWLWAAVLHCRWSQALIHCHWDKSPVGMHFYVADSKLLSCSWEKQRKHLFHLLKMDSSSETAFASGSLDGTVVVWSHQQEAWHQLWEHVDPKAVDKTFSSSVQAMVPLSEVCFFDLDDK